MFPHAIWNGVVIRDSARATIADLASGQWGLVTSRQVADSGLAMSTWHRLVERGEMVERVARGIYRFRTAPVPDHLELRAAWLQLSPDMDAWERLPEHGVVSHRSAAALYGLGHLPADIHEFTIPGRRHVRRPDVRVHKGKLADDESRAHTGLLVTRPIRISSDLLAAREDPEAVGQVVADSIRNGLETPRAFVPALARYSSQFGLRRRDGVQLLRWLLDLVGDPQTPAWMKEARVPGGEFVVDAWIAPEDGPTTKDR
jgi:hypothetical protein